MLILVKKRIGGKHARAMSYLVGYRVHFSGVTGTVLDGETPIEGSGSVRIY